MAIAIYAAISAGIAFLQWRYWWVWVWIASYLTIVGLILALIFGVLNLIF